MPWDIMTTCELDLQEILDSIAYGVLVFNKRGIIEYTNKAINYILGYPKEGLVGCSINELIFIPNNLRYETYLEWLFADDNEISKNIKNQLEARCKDKTLLRVSLSTNAFAYEGRGYFSAIIQDLTKQLEIEAKLEQRQKHEAMGLLSSGIAHEINTPTQYVSDNIAFLQDSLKAIFSMLDNYEVLQARCMEEGFFKEETNNIENIKKTEDLDYLRTEMGKALDQSLTGVQKIAKIVRTMRSFSQAKNATKEPTDINKLIRDAVELTENKWRYAASMECALDPELPQVPCLSVDIGQVLVDLIMNASDAIQEAVSQKKYDKGKITISTWSNEFWVEIRIQDDGVGIREEFRKNVFDPFFTTKKVGEGIGQGLTMAQKIIEERHGGGLFFESREGEGTTFVAQIPLPSNDHLYN